MLSILFLVNRLGIFRSWTLLQASEIYCPDPSLPCVTKLYPPPNHVLPPYIIHMRADREYSTLVDFIFAETKLPRDYIEELINFGAVYLQVEAKIQRMNKIFKKIPIQTYCRVHVNPRRYADIYRYTDVDWKQSILAQSQQVLVVSKPQGCIPSCPTVDNDKENVLSKMKTLLGLQDIHGVGRLDACTSGMLDLIVYKL